MQSPSLALAQFKILLSALGFGSMAILARFAYADGVSTPSLLFLRFFLAGILLLPWVLWKKLPWPRVRALLVLIAMGSMGDACKLVRGSNRLSSWPDAV